jgi:hypothetical protein
MRYLIVHNWEVISWAAWAGALLYASVYAALFLVATCFVFRRKPVN